MRTTYLAVGVGAFLAAAILVDYFKPDTTPPPPPAGPIPLVCERDCLEGVVDQYLDALVSAEASSLPVSEDLRVSENNQMLEFGDGFWRTATGRADYAHYFVDPVVGQAAFMGTMEEGDSIVLMALRIGIELGRITEAETFASRLSGDGPFFDELEEPDRVWFEAVSASERLSRPEMIAVANAYFEGLQMGGDAINRLFTPDCYKVENGEPVPCRTQARGGNATRVTNVHQRRFPLVDAERGVVWTYSVRDHDGTPEYSGAVATAEPAPVAAPQSFHAVEAFLIEGGRIRRIETVLFPAPYHSNSPWDGGLSGR